EDMELLEKIAQVAASAHAPFLSAAAPDMMNLDNFTNLGAHRDIGKVFDNSTYAKWKSFRQSDDSRYVGLTLPHVLMRLPYGADRQRIHSAGSLQEHGLCCILQCPVVQQAEDI